MEDTKQDIIGRAYLQFEDDMSDVVWELLGAHICRTAHDGRR